jgi:hypothetical protein
VVQSTPQSIRLVQRTRAFLAALLQRCKEGNRMPLNVLRSFISQRILLLAACALTCTWLHAPMASAQRVGPIHSGGYVGGHYRSAGPVSAPRVAAAARPMFFRPSNGFAQAPFLFLRQPFFLRASFLWSWEAFDSSWWLYCGPIWGWNSGCDNEFFTEHATEHYLAPPLTYAGPVYVYSLDGHPLVQLYLKDGSVYSVNDYWFVDDQIHFTMLDQSGTKSLEQVIPFDDLEVQRTIDANSRRGFRVVMRNEPIEQYLRDHPDLDPPLLQPSQNH